MHAYRYDQTTREYLGPCPLVPNPRRPEAPALPAFSTDQAPPDIPAGHAARWTGSAWELVEDHRGTRYWLPEDDWTHDGREMTDLGPLPEGASRNKPEMSEDVRQERAAQAVRSERDRRLAACDYLMMPDYPLAGAERTAWAAYRQALRDLPEQAGFPWSGLDDPTVPWPVEPVEG